MLRAASRSLRRHAQHDASACALNISSLLQDAAQQMHEPAQRRCFAAAAAAPAADSGAAAVSDEGTQAVGRTGTGTQQQLQQKLQHRASLSRLRKQWAAEQAAVRAKREAAAAKRAAAAAEAKAAADLRRQEKQQAEAQQEQLHLQEEAQERQRLRAEAAERRRATELVYDMYREDRVQWLAEQSRNWIAPDQLDERIEWALSHPQPLGGTGSRLFAEEQRRQHRRQERDEQRRRARMMDSFE